LLREDRRRCATLVLVEEHGIPAISLNRRTVGEPESLTRMGCYAEARENIARHKGINRAGVHQEINRLALCRVSGIRNVEAQNGKTHNRYCTEVD
jgi:hypothetical protein